jgi:TonB family protein
MQPSLAWNNLLTYSLQVGLLVGLLAFVPAIFRLRAPRARLLYWHLLLGACLLLPLIRPWRQQVIAGTVEVTTFATHVAPPAPSHRPIPWNSVALAIVAAGALGRLAWLAIGCYRLRRYERHSRPAPVASDYAVYLSDDVASPVTFGLRRPVILLPANFPDLPASMQQAILCHESLHVERRDWLFTLLEELVRAVFWFHPAIWWLLGEIQLAREQAVDELVVARTGARDPYIDALLAIAGAGVHLDLAPAPLFLRRRHLKQRVIGILKERHMSHKFLIPALAASLMLMAAACWFVTGAVPLAAAPQAVADAAGVSVDTNGAALMHRAPVSYPVAAIQKGIQGTVMVQVKLDNTGEVVDATVLSGPEELRRPVISSVLNWHFAKDAAGSTRTVSIEFALPKTPVPAEPTVMRRAAVPAMPANIPPRIVSSIDVAGMSDQAREQLLASLPVHVGDPLDTSRMTELGNAVRAFDSHLTMSVSTARDGGAALRIAPADAAVPQKIRVGGNVQAAMIVQKVVPIYPPDAKAARIQGKVRLAATIGPDGHVVDLQPVTDDPEVSSDPSLIKAATDAVWQWVYKPTLLNGNPVSVATMIDVNFTLAQ